MGYKLKHDHPHFPEGHEFGISGLGVFKNGETREISEDEERFFVAHRGMTLEDAFGNSATSELTGSSSLSNEEVTSLLPPPPIVVDELDSMKKDELVDLANAHDVNVTSSMKKDEIIDVLQGGEE